MTKCQKRYLFNALRFVLTFRIPAGEFSRVQPEIKAWNIRRLLKSLLPSKFMTFHAKKSKQSCSGRSNLSHFSWEIHHAFDKMLLTALGGGERDDEGCDTVSTTLDATFRNHQTDTVAAADISGEAGQNQPEMSLKIASASDDLGADDICVASCSPSPSRLSCHVAFVMACCCCCCGLSARGDIFPIRCELKGKYTHS